jgi:hypothetical protein
MIYFYLKSQIFFLYSTSQIYLSIFPYIIHFLLFKKSIFPFLHKLYQFGNIIFTRGNNYNEKRSNLTQINQINYII